MKKKLASLNFILVFILFLVGCVDIPNNFIAPEWNVDLNVPILNESYIVDDIIESDNDNIFSIDPIDSLYIIQSENLQASFGFSQFIQLTNESSVKNNYLPAVEFDSVQIFLPFPDSIQLEKAKFKSGSLSFSVDNQSLTDYLTINLKIPGILKPDGGPLVLDFQVPPSQKMSSTYFLEGHSYAEPANQNSQFKGQIMAIAKGSSTDITASAIFDMNASAMRFKEARGYIPTKIIKTEKQTFSLDLGLEDFKDKISLKDAVLNLNSIYQSVGSNPFDIEIRNLKIVAKRNNGEQMPLTFIENSKSNSSMAFRFSNGRFGKAFSEENSNINDFIAFLPDSISITADYVLNPDNLKDYRNVIETDSILFETNFNTKSFLSIRKSTLADTIEVNISDDDRNEISKSQAASITIEAENRIPLTAFFKIILTDENYNPLFTLSESQGVDSVQFTGATVDYNTGEVLESSLSTHTFELSGEELQKFGRSRYALLSISLRTKDALDSNSNPPFVAVHPSDWIKIKSFGQIKYHVNLDNN
ncbi:MAG: hypothetical protein ABI550_08530 [Ignavibacteriaceae bacterium]